MNPLVRFFRRLKFRRTVQTDQSINVVDGMAKARKLYKKLSVEAHPDKNLANRDVAEDLMKRIVANKHDYAALLALEQEVSDKLK